LTNLPIEHCPADLELTRLAAEIKAQHKLGYADSFAAALAVVRRAEILTADADFRRIQSQVRVTLL
jgi:predicted nucleic acid-binding protein